MNEDSANQIVPNEGLAFAILSALLYARVRQMEAVLLHNANAYSGAIILSTSCLEMCGRATLLEEALTSKLDIKDADEYVRQFSHERLLHASLKRGFSIPRDLTDTNPKRLPGKLAARIHQTREIAQYPNLKHLLRASELSDEDSINAVAESANAFTSYVTLRLPRLIGTEEEYRSHELLLLLQDFRGIYPFRAKAELAVT